MRRNMVRRAEWGETGDAADCLVGLPLGCEPYTGTQEACARYVISEVSGQIGPGLGRNMSVSITGPIWGQLAYHTNAYNTAPSPGAAVFTNNAVITGPDSGNVEI